MKGYGKMKSPWGKLKKGQASKLNQVAQSGMISGKSKKLKLPK